MRLLLSAGGLAWCLALAPTARAADYRAPDPCPDAASFRAAVSARTEQPMPGNARIRIVKRDGDFEGTLVVAGRRRTVALETCAAVVEALALSLALQLEREPAVTQPAAVPAAPASPPATPVPAKPLPAVTPLAPTSPPATGASPAGEEARWSVEGGFGLAARWGRGRGAHAEPSIFAGVNRVQGAWSLSLRIAAFRSQSGELVEAGPGTARLAITGGRAEVCPLGWSFPRATGLAILDGCGTLEIGRIEGVGRLEAGAREASTWFAAGANVRLRARPIRLLGFEATAGLSAPLTRYRLIFELPTANVYQLPEVGGHLGGAVFLAWP